MRVLVTDAGYKNALCAIRSLGSHGVTVIAGAATSRAQGFYSRYAAEKLVYPDPRDEEQFLECMLEQARSGLDVILPIGYLATTVLAKRKAQFAGLCAIPVADWEAMQIANNKARTMELAAQVGVPMPRTFAAPADVDRFPVVAKGTLESGNVHYAKNREELEAVYQEGMLIQEYIPGDGYGFYALYEYGVEKAIFMHRRIREFPVTGGASTAAESMHDAELAAHGRKLLSNLGWHGVAMVEFKKDRRDGAYKLMEINPKFWGSLDLSVTAGVDFPWLTVAMAAGVPFDPVLTYPDGVRFRWVFDDLMHALAKPSDLGAVMRDFWNADTYDNLWLDDWKPNAYAGLATAKQIFDRLRNGTLRFPHGVPPDGDEDR